jgi:hypothetical protein
MQWKIDMSVGIEGAMSDLHYLKNGAGDVAQLDYCIKYFAAHLDGEHTKSIEKTYKAEELDRIYKNIGEQLNNMRKLHANAERHVSSIIEAAIQKER